MNKAILILCHSRAQSLRACMTSVVEARGSSDFRKVVVRQVGHEDVGQIVNEFRHEIDLLIEVEKGASPEESIRRNRFLGYFACYETLQSQVVLAVEDDVQVSSDALEFIDQIHSQYVADPDFMGINLGSVEPITPSLIDSYSLLRYGIHGQASVLSRRTWERLLRSRILHDSSGGHFDLAMEHLLRRGFMVTPNNSRHLDMGYGGTHAPERSENDYFTKIERSWVGKQLQVTPVFHHRQIVHHWRHDAVAYKRWANLYYRYVEPLRRRRSMLQGR